MLKCKDLYNGFINIMNNTNGYLGDLPSVAQQWTNVFQTFYMNQILPIPGEMNPNLFFSLQNFKSGLIVAMQNQIIKQQLEILIESLHLGVCKGVTMTGIYTTTPPSNSLKLQHCFNNKLSIEKIADLLSKTIFIWIQSTFSTEIISGITIKWI